MKPETYTCDMCGQVYEKAWTDDEAMAEAEENFGPEITQADPSQIAIVCDDCYQAAINGRAGVQ